MCDYNVNPNTDALVGGGPDLPSQNVFCQVGIVGGDGTSMSISIYSQWPKPNLREDKHFI